MLATTTVVVDIGRSLREGFFMFWETLWPLILGFGLSGAVQAFVSRDALQQKLGDHRALALVRASGYGMVSSSCSYAASAMAKSLFAKGADYIASMVFMFASTNLVIELGIVLVVLMGWQFAVSEFVGGVFMIALLATLGALWLRGRRITEARERLNAGADDVEHHHAAEHAELQRQPVSVRLRSKAGWADSATYTMSDLTMLRREMVIGYTVAGFLAVLVPTSVWQAVFISGHGVWTSLENVIVGPFIAIISFVCSIGNVPLAAALWSGGISFGGVISFIFADLIAFPLLMIYRRYYGTRIMLRMLAVFWAMMSTAGLITEGIFRGAGLVPTVRPTTIAPAHFSWNYTTYLNVVFLALFGLLYWTYRNRERLGAGSGYAKDPVCGMQVEIAHAPTVLRHGGERVFFCSDHCADRFGAAAELTTDQPVEASPLTTATSTNPLATDRSTAAPRGTKGGNSHMKEDRIIQQVDKMVKSGRITPEEAARLRATEGTADFDVVVGEIRARHAGAHMEVAIAEGEMSREEAADLLTRLRRGEHPKGLRARLRMHRAGTERTTQEPGARA